MHINYLLQGCAALRLYSDLVSVSAQLKTGNTTESIARGAQSQYRQFDNLMKNVLCYWKIISRTLDCAIPIRHCRRHLTFPNESTASMANMVLMGLRGADVLLAGIIETATTLHTMHSDKLKF